MNNITFYDFMRTGHVSRWHTVQTSRPQTLAEHLCLVAMLALEIFHKVEPIPLDVATAEEHERGVSRLLIAALFHDLAEMRYGDLPTPGKAMVREFVGDPQFFEKLDRSIMGELPYIGGEVPLLLAKVVKLADDIESAHFIMENGVGAHAKMVAQGAWKAVCLRVFEYTDSMPNVDWPKIANEVLMDLGMPYISANARFSPP